MLAVRQRTTVALWVLCIVLGDFLLWVRQGVVGARLVADAGPPHVSPCDVSWISGYVFSEYPDVRSLSGR